MPTDAPELPEGWAAHIESLRDPEYINYRAGNTDPQLAPFWLHLPRLRALLASQGLHVVSEAETREARRLQEQALEWSEQWRSAAIAWQEWAAQLLARTGLQWKGGAMGDRVAREKIEAHVVGAKEMALLEKVKADARED